MSVRPAVCDYAETRSVRELCERLSAEFWGYTVLSQPTAENFVYLIGCRSTAEVYVKIGCTSSIRRRLSNIQTGCPYPIEVAFAITSEYREEVVGLEHLLHKLLSPHRLRAEWYLVSHEFLAALEELLSKINRGFSFDEVYGLPDFCGPELDGMLHRHSFVFNSLVLPLRRNVLEGAISVESTALARGLFS